jgi:hypothetical protein
MNHPLSSDLEITLGRELRQLPSPRAPHTLLPRVLAAVNAWTRRPWYERAWFTWPLGWQIASAATLVLLVAGGGMLLTGARDAAVAAASPFSAPAIGEVASLAGRAVVAVNAAAVLWRAIGQPFVPYVFALVMLMHIAFERIVPR